MIFNNETAQNFNRLLIKYGFEYINNGSFVESDFDSYLINGAEINIPEGILKNSCSCYINLSSGEICMEYEFYLECENECCNKILLGKSLKIYFRQDYDNSNFLPIIKFINEYLCFTNLIKTYKIEKADDIYELLSIQ